MANGKNPLMLMMALAMPGAAHALGLGDIHVDSALNERLIAEIDIVGATAAELSDLRAAVANRDTFLRYGADRPAFLSSATFKVGEDSRGRPVLAIRSTEAFSEPMVNFLVDLRWHNGELVRQYTLLLDPPGFAAANKAAELARAAAAPSLPPVPAAPDVPVMSGAAAPIVETKTQTVASRIDPPNVEPKPTTTDRGTRKTTHVKIGAKATLRGVAWRVGERSESDIQRTMLAIFRANPSAFDGNINRLHLGAVLSIPSRTEVAAISRAEARREIRAQMQAWRTPGRALQASAASSAAPVAPPESSSTATAVLTTMLSPAVATASAAAPTDETRSTETSDAAALDSRVEVLEHELVEMKGLLENQSDKLAAMRQQAAQRPQMQAEKPVAEEEAAPADKSVGVSNDVTLPQAKSEHSLLGTAAAGAGLLAAALAALYAGMRRRARKLTDRVGAEPPIDDMEPGRKNDVPALGSGPGNAPQEEEKTDTPDSSRTGAFADEFTPVYSEASSNSSDAQTQVPAASAPLFDEDTQPLLPVAATSPAPKRINNAAATISRPDAGDTVNQRAETVNLALDAQRIDVTRIEATHLDYNLLDLDMTAQHVQMPSVLNEHVVVKERRTNLADVLKLAIEREPDRHDLRMKLLELYYSAAATNRHAFLEVVQRFARDRDHMQSEQWDKIAFMGRQIASENPLFAEPDTDDALADCA